MIAVRLGSRPVDLAPFRNEAVAISAHATGLVKLSLPAARGNDAAHLRLHLWLKSCSLAPSPDYEPAHNHRWAFRSLVLVGALEERLSEISNDGEEHDSYAFWGHRDPPVRTGHALLKTVATYHQTAGTIYERDARTIHSIRPGPGEELTATIFWRSDVTRRRGEIFLQPHQLLRDNERPLAPAELRHVREIVEFLHRECSNVDQI